MSARALATGLLALLLAACASTTAPPPPPSPLEAELRQRILEETLAQLGRPYRYGGGDHAGFDCSGLALHVYADAGIALPRTAALQQQQGRAVAPETARPGDLFFYRIEGGDHVVVFIGDGRAVHAPRPGRTVSIAEIGRDWWRERLVSARRFIDG